jgi:drug/metabolite transporter (DMT)-like permease
VHAAILAAGLFALTGVCAAQASWLIGAARANAWRLVIAVAVLAAWAHTMGPGIGGSSLGWFLVAGAVGFGCGGWCVFQALRRIGSTLTLLVVECVATAVAAIIGWGVLGAALSAAETTAVFLIIAGIVIGMRPGPLPALSRPQVLAGCLFAVAAGILQAVSFNLSKHAFNLLAAAGEVLPPLGAAYHRLLGGAAVAILLHTITSARCRRAGAVSAAVAAPFPGSPVPAPAWVAMNALFGPVLGVTCMLWAISLVDNPGVVQAVAATATLMTIPLARRLEGARPNTWWFAGCATAIGGVAVLVW